MANGVIPIRRIRRGKPLNGASIASKYRNSALAVWNCRPSNFDMDDVGKYTPTVTQNSTPTQKFHPAVGDMVEMHPSTDLDEITWPTAAGGDDNSSFTFFLMGQTQNVTTANGYGVGRGKGNSDWSAFLGTGSITANRLGFSVVNSSPAQIDAVGTATYSTGDIVIAAGRFANNQIDLFDGINKEKVTTTSAGSALRSVTSGFGLNINSMVGTKEGHGYYSFFAVIEEAIPDNEIWRVLDNIGRLYQPQTQLLPVGTVAVGGATGKSNPFYGPLGGPLVGVM